MTASATDIADAVRAGERSPVDVVEETIERIEDRNDHTNAFVTVTADDARERARELEREIEDGGDPGPLAGVPVAIKDLTPVAGVRTTYGSAPLEGNVPDEDAPVVARLKEAGAIVVGKTNTSEFGHVAVTDNPLFGPTGTPFDPEKTAGGSSGGSAAAVADGLVPLAEGSDAGGSIRIPASACGVYGIKPSFGRVPNPSRPDGLIQAQPFSCVGPIARTVTDAAAMLDVAAGTHPRDPFSLPDEDGSYRAAVDRPVDDLRVAYSPDLAAFAVSQGVRDVVEDAADALANAGMTVERADPALDGLWDRCQDASRTIFQARMAELGATSEDAFGVDLRDHLDDLTPSLAAMMKRGENISAVEFGEANAVRTEVFDAVQDCLTEYDLLVSPTLGTIPFDKTEPGPQEIDGEEVDPYTGWYLTQPFNMTGHPAASAPAGMVDGLPVGLQLVGRRHADGTVLAASAALERERPWQDTY